MQANGFAVCPKSDQILSVGKPTDNLRAFVCDKRILREAAECTRDQHLHRGHVIYTGSKAEIENVITHLKKGADEFNRQGFKYNVVSLNSNTVFSALIRQMQDIVEIDTEAVFKTVALRKVTPGIDANLITRERHLRTLFNRKRTFKLPRIKLQIFKR